MKSEHGEFELDVPRDRNGSFEPEIVKKNQRTMSSEIEEKILALYAHGNSYTQIAEMIEDIYGVGFSKGARNTVTGKIIPYTSRVENKTSRRSISIYIFRCHPLQSKREL